MAIFCPTGPTNRSRPIANLFNFYVLVQFGWNLVSGLRLPCYSPAPFMLLLCSYSTPSRLQLLPCPCRTLALLLPYYCPAHFKLLSGTFLAPPQVLPSSCPLSALFCFTLLSSATALFLPCSCPAPALLILQPRSCFAPALLLVLPTLVWQPSLSAPYNFFWHGKSHLLW